MQCGIAMFPKHIGHELLLSALLSLSLFSNGKDNVLREIMIDLDS
jgi:hypothetical protein